MIRKSLSPACIAVAAVEPQDLELLRLPVNRSHSVVVPELGKVESIPGTTRSPTVFARVSMSAC